MSQSQQFPPSRRQTQMGSSSYGSSSQHDELHMSSVSQPGSQMSMSPRDYAPQIKVEPSPANPQYQPTSSVPNVLQPAGGLSNRPPALSANTAPNLPVMQAGVSQSSQQQQQHPPHSVSSSQPPNHSQNPQDYPTPSKPPLSMSHGYSRSSPAAGYDAPGGYHAYTPTTPSGVSSSQFMSPTDAKYNAPGSQRNISNTPLGLADIRPRADSSMSDGTPGGLGYDVAGAQSGTSNYLAPWAIYAFDWCKWAPQANGAGKLAVGSYLEDGHNFVRGRAWVCSIAFH